MSAEITDIAATSPIGSDVPNLQREQTASEEAKATAAELLKQSPKFGYRPEIDGLRALAVVGVIVNHFASDLLPGGYLGVDIFFVISGYVITSSLWERRETRLADFLLGFYVRRVKRLLPALVVCILITAPLLCLFDRYPGRSLWTGIASLFGLSNLYLYDQTTDYFGGLAKLNVFTQTWSLGVEEQFYLFFPLILWVVGTTGVGAENFRRRGALIAFIGLLSLAAFIALSSVSREAVYYLMPMRMWELNAGALVYFVTLNPNSALARLPRNINPSVLLAGIVFVLFLHAQFEVSATIVIVLLTALLIAAIRSETLGYRLLSHTAATYLGRISYSLYLWHWSVISLSRWTVGIHPWTTPVQVGLMLLLAYGSFRYVEKPLRGRTWSASPVISLRYGVYTAVGAGCVLLILAEPLDGRLYSGTPALIASGVETLTDTYTIPGGYSWNGEKCVLSNDSQVGKTISVDSCTLGDFSKARRRVLVAGNSFAAAFVQAFDRLVSSDKYAVTITSSWGAAPVANIPNEGQWAKANDYYWTALVPDLVSRLKRDDWVFLASDLADFSPKERTIASDRKLMQLQMSLSELSARLSRNGIHLAVLHGLPFGREGECDPSIATGQQWFTPFDNPCHFISRSETLARRANLDTMLLGLQSQGKIAVIDLMGIFCPATRCTYNALTGPSLYRDVYAHPSIEAARLSSPLIRAVLTADIAVRQKDQTPDATAAPVTRPGT